MFFEPGGERKKPHLINLKGRRKEGKRFPVDILLDAGRGKLERKAEICACSYQGRKGGGST